MVEAGKAILKFYKRARGNNEATGGIKRGKSMSSKHREPVGLIAKKQP
jgi:hypothetical protein